MLARHAALAALIVFASASSAFANLADSDLDGVPDPPTSAVGCTAGGTEGTDYYSLVADSVWACRGTFSNGLNDPSTQLLCGVGYQICPSTAEMQQLGLDSASCGSLPNDDEFYASAVSSNGGLMCSATGTDDLWGCARSSVTNNVLTTEDGAGFGCDGTLNAFIASDAQGWSGGAWSFASATDELNTASLSDPSFGGVLCCAAVAYDNCPAIPNADQTDTDNDGIGDACDTPAAPVPSMSMPVSLLLFGMMAAVGVSRIRSASR